MLGGIQNAFGLFLPRLVYRFEDGREARPPKRVVMRREITAGIKRLEVGCQEQVIRPAATLRHELSCQHVDAVDVGTLFPVHLDVDEPRVHEFGELGQRVNGFFRDVTPIAGAVTDRQKDGLILPLGLGERFWSPWIPVHRVVGMKQEIRVV